MPTKFSALLALFILVALFSFAQDSASKNLPNTIYLTKGLKFTINGQTYKVDESIKTYLSKNANALYEYHEYKKNELPSTLLAVVLIGSCITAATQIGHKNNLTLDFGLAGLVALFTGPHFFRKSMMHLRKGVCYYNQQFGY